MSGNLRRAALTIHVATSVGWLGAVASFLCLAVTGLATADHELARTVYPAMRLIAWYVIVPLGVASLLTGLLQSLGTAWGLFRHYWVLAKLVINVFATIILLLYLESVDELAAAAGAADFGSDDLRGLRVQAVVHSGAAVSLLLVATVLSVFKPRGLTPYGLRRSTERRRRPGPSRP